MYTRVRELREQKGISQLSLGLRVGCSQNTISKIVTMPPAAAQMMMKAIIFLLSVLIIRKL